MTIFYFTATGNSFAVAKKIGGTSRSGSSFLSIPQVVSNSHLHFKDDVIGLVFPVYGLGLPEMVRAFLKKATWEADYAFAVGTYGCLPGAAARNVQRFIRKQGNRLDYAQSLLMVDNFLPGFDIGDQIAKIPRKQTDAHLAQITVDIQNRKPLDAKACFFWRVASVVMKQGERTVMGSKQGQRYIVNGSCVKCGVCAKVCPAGNIAVTERVAFGDQCERCLSCLHLCPKNAIHMRNEKSAARWRHPEVSLSEIIAANNRSRCEQPEA
ncbi:MAG: EFR1 family ferrodoxin [Oscillospiraceae bacterium]|jgi:ferredoxin|nr:EFR1 family ferrodoxin [Oscillospiraceae bacterium]